MATDHHQPSPTILSKIIDYRKQMGLGPFLVIAIFASALGYMGLQIAWEIVRLVALVFGLDLPSMPDLPGRPDDRFR